MPYIDLKNRWELKTTSNEQKKPHDYKENQKKITNALNTSKISGLIRQEDHFQFRKRWPKQTTTQKSWFDAWHTNVCHMNANRAASIVKSIVLELVLHAKYFALHRLACLTLSAKRVETQKSQRG